MSTSESVLPALRVALVLLGVTVVYYASKGYLKRRSRSLLFLGIGFLFVTASDLSELLLGLLHFHPSLLETVEAAVEVLGFMLIVYSIVGVKD